MMEKAKLKKNGLEIDPVGVPQTTKLKLAALQPTDSFGQFMLGLYKMFNKPYLRPVKQTQYGFENIDQSVEDKLKADTGYKPKNPGLPWLEDGGQ
jgi:putative IMPACT (imprinted ancient) family translation regulator